MLFVYQSKEKAHSYLLRAKELNTDLPNEYSFYLGMSLQLNGKYDEALSAFQQLKIQPRKNNMKIILI